MKSAILAQGRVIYALVLLLIASAHSKAQQGYFWTLFDSSWLICFFLVIRSFRGFAPPQGMPLLLFLLSGFIPFLMFRKTTKKCIAIFQKKSILLNIPIISNLDLCIAQMIFIWITEMTVACMFLVIGALCGIGFHIDSWGKFLFVFLVSPALGLGTGTFCASLVALYPILDKVFTIILRVSMFISGVFYSVSNFPSFIMEYLWYNPLLQMVEICRASLSSGYDAMDYSMGYVASSAVVMLCLGLLLERYVRRHKL